MIDTMEYKGYVARIEFDPDDKVFYGIVKNVRDTIHFEGRSAGELEEAFRDSVEAYFEFCEQCGDEPQRPISGTRWLEMRPELLQKVELSAARAGQTVDAFLEDLVENWYRGQNGS